MIFFHTYIHTYWHTGVHRVREEARKQSPNRGLYHIAEKKGLCIHTYIHTYTCSRVIFTLYIHTQYSYCFSGKYKFSFHSWEGTILTFTITYIHSIHTYIAFIHTYIHTYIPDFLSGLCGQDFGRQVRLRHMVRLHPAGRGRARQLR